jgi:hypothetical protein
MTASHLLEQPCDKFRNAIMLVANCYSLFQTCYNNWEQAVRTQLVDGFLANLLQDVRFFCVYKRKYLTSCSKSANKPSTSCVRTACPKLSTSLEQAVKYYLKHE